VESAVRDVSGHLLESDDEILTSLDMLIEAGRPRPEAFPSEKPQLDYFGMDLIRRSDY